MGGILKYVYLSLLLSLTVSCGSLQKSKVSNRSFISGPLPTGFSAEEVEEDLTRQIRVATSSELKDTISVTAVLQTPPLIQAQELEAVKKGLQTKDEAKVNIKKSVKVFTKKKSCFLVEIKVYDVQERAAFKFWEARVVTHLGKEYPLRFKTLRKLATGTHEPLMSFRGMIDSSKAHKNYSLACSNRPFDMTSPFQLQISPQWDPSKPWYSLEWM